MEDMHVGFEHDEKARDPVVMTTEQVKQRAKDMRNHRSVFMGLGCADETI